MEAAGSEASRVGHDRAVQMFREAPRYAQGVYLIAPFRQPERILPLIDEASEGS